MTYLQKKYNDFIFIDHAISRKGKFILHVLIEGQGHFAIFETAKPSAVDLDKTLDAFLSTAKMEGKFIYLDSSAELRNIFIPVLKAHKAEGVLLFSAPRAIVSFAEKTMRNIIQSH